GSEAGEDILKRIANDPSSLDFRSNQAEGKDLLCRKRKQNLTLLFSRSAIRFFALASDPPTAMIVPK
ncbi:MAG TPA: hypothetical protein VFJ27_10630, partial [Terriglobia bacterium]|nr:hypothetical protein [Terriglobia bacterium]